MNTWTSKQIAIIAELVERFCTADPNLKIDRRRVDRKVVEWAVCMGLIQRDDTGAISLATHSWQYDEVRSTPIEALWLIVRRHVLIGDHAGASIRRNDGWQYLNTFHEGQPGYTNRDYEAQSFVLCRLQQHGYLIFQSGGDVWDIWIKPQHRKQPNTLE